MSLFNKEGSPPPPIVGLTVKSAVHGCDDCGYGFVEIRFTNGDVLRIEERGQCGEIGWRYGFITPTTPRNPER